MVPSCYFSASTKTPTSPLLQSKIFQKPKYNSLSDVQWKWKIRWHWQFHFINLFIQKSIPEQNLEANDVEKSRRWSRTQFICINEDRLSVNDILTQKQSIRWQQCNVIHHQSVCSCGIITCSVHNSLLLKIVFV